MTDLPPARSGRAPPLSSPLLDGLLAAGLAILVLASAVHPQPGFRSGGVPGLGLGVLLAAPLAWRRGYPRTVLAVTLAAFAAASLPGLGAASSVGPLGSLIALYTLALQVPPRRSMIGLGVAESVFLLAALGQSHYSHGPDMAVLIVIVLGLGAAAWGLGAGHRRVRAHTHRLETLSDQLRKQQQIIARHKPWRNARGSPASSTMLSPTTSASLRCRPVPPGRCCTPAPPGADADADAALRFIHATSRDALGEMRRLIGILQPEDHGGEEPSLAPQPTIACAGTLIDRANQAGLPTDLVVEGQPRPLPTGLDLAAYRIVQEALTNAMKHAGDAHATVTIRYASDRLDVEVVDDGNGHHAVADPSACGTGQGLPGMRDRVALFGGRFEAGPRPAGGFGVSASLPVATSPDEFQAGRS